MGSQNEHFRYQNMLMKKGSITGRDYYWGTVQLQKPEHPGFRWVMGQLWLFGCPVSKSCRNGKINGFPQVLPYLGGLGHAWYQEQRYYDPAKY